MEIKNRPIYRTASTLTGCIRALKHAEFAPNYHGHVQDQEDTPNASVEWLGQGVLV
jgi:hypothetical protein